MVSERGSENSVTRIENCFGGVDFDEMILESSCVADMAIEGESNDRIGCRVLLDGAVTIVSISGDASVRVVSSVIVVSAVMRWNSMSRVVWTVLRT